jgi:hypothetical protein
MNKPQEQRALKYVIGATIVLVLVVAAMRLLSIPEIDNATLCPKDNASIPQGDLNVLIDRTDALSPLNETVVRQLVGRWASGAVPFQRMNLYVLNNDDIKIFKKKLTVCVPPSEISLRIAKGETVAKSLLAGQEKHIADAIASELVVSEPISKSRIIEAVRQITNSTWPPHSKLLLISDLIEISELADFYYTMAPNFDIWKRSTKGSSILAEIMLEKGNSDQICELQTDRPDYSHRGDSRVFWQRFFYEFGITVKAGCSEILI